MATKKKKSNKFGITPSVIFLNLTIILFLVIVCFFAYNVIKDEDAQTSSVAPFTPVTEETESSAPESEPVESDSSSSTESENESSSSPETSENNETSSITSEGTSSEDITSEDTSSDGETLDTYFDSEYFDNALFIGDSISTGLSLYGFLDSENVFATQGLAPSTVLSVEIDGKTFSDKIASFKPEKIFIMLGTNSVGYADAEYLVESMKSLVDNISSSCKSEIYVLSIPPVTREAEARQDNYLSIDAINEYNEQLRSAITGTSAKFIDFNSILSDSDGYFNEDYAEMDGIHFMGSTYQVMLSYLQKITS